MVSAVAALVRERGGPVALADVTLRAPGEGELLVRIMASGVCPTDLFGIGGGAGDRFPAVFGHEGAGVVEAVGPGATGFAPGDRVVLSFDSCGACAACTAGHPAYCARFAELNYAASAGIDVAGEAATTGWMGQSSWATRVVARTTNAVRVDADVPWAVAATLGCGILTGVGTIVNVLRPGPADTLLVIGAGTTGLAAVMAARHRGVADIVVSDPSAERRALALRLGATRAIAPEDAGGIVASRALDTVGAQDTIDAALSSLAPRGVCATVALRPGSNRVTVSQSQLLWGRTFTGVIEGDADIRRDIPLLVALWRIGRLPVERLLTTYPFAEVSAAVADARAGRTIKPVLVMSDEPVAPEAATTRHLRDARESDLPALWRSLPAVAPGELRGLWHGRGLSTAHRAHRLLERSGWFGKLFRSDDDVAPLVCTGPSGGLFIDERLARGGARLLTAGHDGIVTAAMAYDGQPLIDHFTRLSPTEVLGVMTGRDAADGDRLYYFVLEKVADRPVETG